MRCTTRTAVALALGWVAVGAADASAAWNNVFQATCNGRSSRSSFFAPAPSAACCPSVSYVQRCYYQPVTTYKQETYYEPVTTYKTSYYWEGVTRYRYTSYYDPCTGCCKQVCTPCTTYSLRSQCNAVQSYVQRCRMVPCTEMRKSFYLEPVVTYSNPCCESPCPTPPCSTPNAGVAETPGKIPPAGIGGGAGINESSEPPRNKIPGTPESNPRRALPVPSQPLKADRVASRSTAGKLQGQFVHDDRITPRANATLRFVNDQDVEVLTKADLSGRFAIQLPAGEWTLYAPNADGKSVFHSTVLVRHSDDRNVTVVSR